ncbi:MAG TPA: ribbon-helix-helix protein, CopG family [Vicinamibacteria bacterium]
MATHTVKTTYALDVETMRTLEDLARRWNVSKSEALRRAIRISSAQAPPEDLTPIQALDRLQRSMALTPRDAARWATAARAERKERSRRQEGRSR